MAAPFRVLALSLLLALIPAACADAGDDAPADAASAEPPAATSAPADAGDEGQQLLFTSGETAPTVTVWKSPTCGCCGEWIEHLEAAGFKVDAQDVQSLAAVKQEHGIAPGHQACHTATVNGYLVEGHVPAEVVARMLREEPDIKGLAVPGMPVGSPGMEVDDQKEPYDVLALTGDGEAVVYDSR